MLLVLFISISAVSAEGNFTALQEEINSSTDSIEITQNYVYDNSTDTELDRGIIINKTNFVINGNGHTIDGAGQIRLLDTFGTNITINNLTLINGKSETGSAIRIEANSSIMTNNVIFENNVANIAGAAILNFGDYTSTNDRFINNNAKQGSSIYSVMGIVTLSNGTFRYENPTTWGLLYLTNTLISIENNTFANITSNYSTAIHIKNSKGKIKNCDFVNLTAMTAGAIGIKLHFEDIIIEDCNFINVTSQKNGGAIYADVGGERGLGHGNITIFNSQFSDCHSEFGGAYVQLAGNLTISYTNFTSNSAVFDGGAIYTSWADVILDNSRFVSNIAQTEGFSNGGAAYFDNGDLTLDSCAFENNTANEASSIYMYDAAAELYDNYFNNPTADSTSIYAVYSNCSIVSGNNFTDDLLSLNNTNYNLNVKGNQIEYEIINNIINVTTLPKRFDLRDWGWVSPVKDQGGMGACWAFGVTGALESILIRHANITYDFSENNLQNTMLRYSKYGNAQLTEGGDLYSALYYFASWLGMSPGKFDTYDEFGKISPLIYTPYDIQLKDIVLLTQRANSTDNDQIKEAVLKYGALAVSYYHDQNPIYFNDTTNAYYYNGTLDIDHTVCLVGWDDNYPRENFVITPPGDGAFIIKNSWGDKWGENGYFYVSYYDTCLSTITPTLTFDIHNTNEYDCIYQYETCFTKPLEYQYSMNRFVAMENTLIAAVGFISTENEPYEISILVNGDEVYNQSGICDINGYSTVELNENIKVKEGDEFAVVLKLNGTALGAVRFETEPNVSFVSSDGVNWEALNNEAPTIKVYTKNLSIYTEDLVKIYKNESQFEAYVSDAGVNVTFEINGANYTRVSDENGTAKMNINLGPGNYTINTYYNGESVENSIQVLPTLIAQNLVKYYRNESQFYVSLIDGEGNPVSGVDITMNINGVFYNRTTNENGTARLNINLNPGEYILTAADPLTGLQMSYNITVLPTLNATDLEMTYKDGSAFKVSVVDGQGNPLANAAVKFNINGVFYTRYANSSGIVQLNINLMSGEYIITSEYNGLQISNTITIKD